MAGIQVTPLVIGPPKAKPYRMQAEMNAWLKVDMLTGELLRQTIDGGLIHIGQRRTQGGR
jgi:hypothetical protein